MKIMLSLACILPVLLTAHPVAAKTDRARWQEQAARVTIQRDDWGIAHVHGRSDADAVFGMIYAQAEDDFNRIEANYLTALGRTAEADGEDAIWQDLRARLYMDPQKLRADYAALLGCGKAVRPRSESHRRRPLDRGRTHDVAVRPRSERHRRRPPDRGRTR